MIDLQKIIDNFALMQEKFIENISMMTDFIEVSQKKEEVINLSLLKKSIVETPFKVNILSELKRKNIQTIGELVNFGETELKLVKGIGIKSLNELKFFLAQNNVSLKK